DGLRSLQKFDDAGRLIQETSRSGDITGYFYDNPQSEWPCATEGPTGSRREMTRNRYGQLLTLTDCSGCVTRYEYDRFGQLTALHQEEGLSLHWQYDARGRLVCHTGAAGHKTQYDYNAAGDLTTVIHPDGSTQTTEYDAAGRPVSTTQGGLTRRMAYDAAGRVSGLVNENGGRTTFTYDALDRRVQETGFDGRTQRYHYSVTGQLICSEDEGLVTRWHYDASDRLSHRTVDGEPAEQWQYDERGWLTETSHVSEGHRVAVHYDYHENGRLCRERQTVHAPQTDALLWQHVTKHAHHHGLANRTTPDRLPPVEWLTYGSGHLAGMKLGETPLISFTRDRLHRETQRDFGTYEQNTHYSASGQLLSHTLSDPVLNREYGYNDNGQLVRISQENADQHYRYDGTGRLVGTQHPDLLQRYATDPAGNRLADRVAHPALPAVWPDNRISGDAESFYHHDGHGRLTGRDERIIRDGGSHCHRYHYDHQHRLVQYTRSQQDHTLTTARYLYDPLGRRTGKVVRETPRDGRPEQVSRVWYGWDGDRLTTTQTDTTRIQTVYLPGSFTPLLRITTTTDELNKSLRRSLAEKLQQDGGVTFPPELVSLLDRLEGELRSGNLSEQSQQWLAQCGLTAERMQNQLEPVHTPQRTIHLYHCDHRGLPLALINGEGKTDWSAEYDAWGNVLSENNPHNLEQHLRLPGQQYDEETGLHYNRHRYYDPRQGRYITQDPIGLMGGWNLYAYPLNPISWIDSLGLASKYGHLKNGGYGARPTPPPKPNPSKLPGIAEKLMPKYSIDQASSEPNVFKTFFTAFSPYDYTPYCKKWVKPNLTCTQWDDPNYPGMDTKTARDYLSKEEWPIDKLPAGYTCAEPYLFPDLDDPGGPATAGIDDLSELFIKGMQRTGRGVRK
ncbi:RHS repeat protein, partial [Yokenella regensburgei]|uniref:RHS repeat-associated core domain-containing protein n=2 Tax=Yokenella regensburgei TaxID=158877 RepID=UPI003F16CD93